MSSDRNLSAQIFQVATGTTEPIYRQLIAQFRRLHAAGQIQAGDTLPSVREVAKALSVNPMTVSKAYSMLESEGALLRQRGVGMSVAQPPTMHASHSTHTDARCALIRPTILRLLAEARQLEFDHASLVQLIDDILMEQTT